jgi:hypothetical protein
MGEMKNTCKILVAKSESRGRSEDLGAQERTTCTFTFQQHSGMCELLALGSGWELVAGDCDHRNEHSGFAKLCDLQSEYLLVGRKSAWSS